MTPTNYLKMLDVLTESGFRVERNPQMIKSYAEFYQWNGWTVQVCAKGFDKVEQLEVHTFFDSECLSWRNEVKVFEPERVVSMVIYAQEKLERLRNGSLALIVEALAN